MPRLKTERYNPNTAAPTAVGAVLPEDPYSFLVHVTSDEEARYVVIALFEVYHGVADVHSIQTALEDGDSWGYYPTVVEGARAESDLFNHIGFDPDSRHVNGWGDLHSMVTGRRPDEYAPRITIPFADFKSMVETQLGEGWAPPPPEFYSR